MVCVMPSVSWLGHVVMVGLLSTVTSTVTSALRGSADNARVTFPQRDHLRVSRVAGVPMVMASRSGRGK